MSLAGELIGAGLTQFMGDGYLRLDPALPAYLLESMAEEGRKKFEAGWAEGMVALANQLYREQFQNAELASRLTALELPNLMAMLSWMEGNAAPEDVVELATSVEALVADQGRSQALAQAMRVRERASSNLGDWSHARFMAERAGAERLRDSGDLPKAVHAARQLLQRSLAVGEDSFDAARYDIALAHYILGQMLFLMGSAEEALGHQQEAQRRFQKLADEGNTIAGGSAATALMESGASLMNLGRYDEAAEAYENAISRLEKAGDVRNARRYERPTCLAPNATGQV